MKIMEINKLSRYLTTVPLCAWWLTDKIEAHRRKKRAKTDADAIDNLERLYRLKERGVISEEEFQELKNKLKQHI